MHSDAADTVTQAGGFSLVETVMALLIFSLMAAILLPTALTSAQRAASDTQAFETDLRLYNDLTAHRLGLGEDMDAVTVSTEPSSNTQLALQTIRIQQDSQTFVAKQIEQVAP